jgi:choline kinase
MLHETSPKIQIVILAAGMGTRLGRPHPKGLTVLDTGETIIGRQIRNIKAAFGKDASITIVVGYKLDMIIDAFPDVNYIYNEAYDVTNTSKSLLKALTNSHKKSSVLWMNGDVVFDERLLLEMKKRIDFSNTSMVSVNSSVVGEEEVKYTLDNSDCIQELSKIIPSHKALGESVGINYVTVEDKNILTYWLGKVKADDYFERGIEMAIEKDNLRFLPYDISLLGYHATEVDFHEDLQQANQNLSSSSF